MIANQQTLAFGGAADVVREVRESVEIYRDARWICAPCHNLQPVSPTENIVALYETIRAVGDIERRPPDMTADHADRAAAS